VKAHSIKQGFALPLVISIFPFIIFLGLVAAELALTGIKVARADNYDIHAQMAADSGADYALNQLNSDSTWTGTGAAVTVHSDSNLDSEFTVNVTNIDDRSKSIIVTGVSSNDTGELSRRSIEVIVRGIGGGSLSVVTGVGGLYMSNSAKILGGNVFVNGEVQMSNTTQIGLESNPTETELRVAHQICGTTNYPRVCADGENGEPIDISNPAQVFANVYANNQSDGSHMSSGGLQGYQPVTDTDNPPIEPQELPVHDRQAQIDNINGPLTRSGNNASCTLNNGTVTWEANTRIEGDVVINKKCTVTLRGDVWIDGKLEMAQNGVIVIDNAIPSSADLPTIMIDDIFEMRNSAEIRANTNSVGARVITYKSSAGCSPDCTDVTGSDLQTSRSIPTITLTQQSAGPESLFYAKWSQVDVGNSGGVGALVGQTINLNQSAAVTFGTQAADGSPARWVIDSYKRWFN
jgi:hypothetical protein